ncbi:MAG: ABC transporter permease [Oscillatoriales cyanobacterium]|nr:MAG: ABC transporter permease [Oscillatoriales cyanobacterium]
MTLNKVQLPRFLNIASPSSLSMKMMWAGLAITALFIIVATLSPVMQGWGWLQNPTDALINPIHEPPSANYWFGTSRSGYDVFSRTLFASRAAWQVVILATALSLFIGVPLGLVSGYLGGKLDRVLLFLMPQYYRVVRNHTASVKTELFVEAARAMGADTWTVLSRYLFLNVIQSVPVLFALNAADAILTLGGLGFLGLGLPEETPEWGHDLRLALDALPTGIWWTALFPGLAMTLMVVGLSLVGEGLNEFVNPRLRNQQ